MIKLNNNYNNIIKASVLIAISGILYGFLGYLGIGILREHFTISTMLFWRFFIAGCWILIFVMIRNSFKEIISYFDKRTLFAMFALGGIGYAGSSAFYFVACKYTGTGLAMVIFFSYPIFVALSSWLMHKKTLSINTLCLLVTMILGLFLLKDANNHFDMMGILFGLIAAACYAFYVVGSKQMTAHIINSNFLTTIICFGCAFIFLILSLSSHSFTFPQSSNTWLHLLALGVLATAIPIQLMLEGLKYVSSMRASIISVLEPLVTIFVGILLLGETISQLQLLGAFIILGSAVLVQFQREL